MERRQPSEHPFTESPTEEYVGLIWIGDEPGRRFRVRARSAGEARRLVEAEHGTGHVITVHNERDASRPRGGRSGRSDPE